MKRIYISLFFITAALALGACEKVIDVDLNTADPRVVIQGNITQEAGPYFVRINQSVNFDESNQFPAVQNALVTISDDAGNTDTLQEPEPGVYATTALQGQPGRTYTLRVESVGKIYTAVSTMPQPVLLDSLAFEDFSGPLGNTRKFTVPVYQDPAGVANFYRFILRVNSLTSTTIFLLDDDTRDGQINTRAIRSFDPEIVSGDSVWVEMQAIDQPVWKYYSGLNETGGGFNQTATPYTPASPIVGENVSGYFSAHVVSRQAAIVP